MISTKRREAATTLGTLVAYDLFVMMLNPKNRGPNFSWDKLKHMAEGLAYHQLPISYEEMGHDRKAMEHFCHSCCRTNNTEMPHRFRSYRMGRPSDEDIRRLEEWQAERRRVDRIIEEIREYTELMNDELQELCDMLVQVRHYAEYCVSDGFEAALVKELEAQLQNFKENCKIIEEEREVTRPEKTRFIEWD